MFNKSDAKEYVSEMRTQLSDINVVFETFIKIPLYLCTNKFLINICGGKEAF